MEVAVPKYIKLELMPASSNIVEPFSSANKQSMSVTNSLVGEKPLLMKLKINFNDSENPVQELVNVGNFPANV